MAQAVKGVYKTKYDAGASGDNVILEGVNGTLQVREDTYVASSLQDASTIDMCADLPAGARIKRIELTCPALATGRTVSIGDVASATRYATTQSVATATTVVAYGSNYKIGTATNDNKIRLTTAGVWTGTVYMNVYYTLA